MERAEQGQIDADLGGGVIKQRIARPGGGKSKGYRSIVLYRKDDRAFFVFGFPKSEQDNIREDEEVQFKKMAKQVLALTDEHLQRLIDNGQFEEVVKDA
ncbi:MAG: type II toxin-antitoxin system RelE/ParE family toxin [Methylobacter sp.]|nr:type II toxin-antitoxin system RelE/ParE family toxin [Methylobacter sp.]MDP2429330.1 type II toxin-antitoxin system RelE/ParE family toxin [Methylobacter sp.]MDP3055041.1 type II toxin-antitoxin system RelE/ParE family toxin [Methylobacter sp.]MDP3364169.1 type II toxin-antitoxin system RelE/ParE family toxin [Methylobacter sp.]MDZ4217548.1 type II toxin-antitoxin system RelE/ParE family toxin [Methylobacter sp.]